MAKVVRIRVQYGGKVNIGDYQNVEPIVEHEVELEDGDDVEAVTREAMQQVKVAVFEEVAALPSRQAKYWLKAVKPEEVSAPPATGDAPGDADKFLF